MPAGDVDAVASLDGARRSLVLLGALLYPLSDERAALDDTDAEAYLNAIAARMQGVCGQSRAVLEHSLKTLAQDGDQKRRRRRRSSQSAPELPDSVQTDVDRIFAECEVGDALHWVYQANSRDRAGMPLEELVPFAARIAAAAVRLAALAADRLDAASEESAGVATGGGESDRQRAAAVTSATGRTARRIAQVLDEWDMRATSPTAMIGCPPPPGSTADGEPPQPDGPEDQRRSLGVTAALGAGSGSAAAGPRSALRGARTKPVWSSGGAVQRD